VERVRCADPDCPVRSAVVCPLLLDDRVVGTLTAYDEAARPGLVRATQEVARWVSGQLELAELDDSRSRLAEAQVKALRAQISPHFVYNALTAIASFVRTDPPRARELLLEFADFTRYSSRTHGEFTTLAEELRSIDRYLLLERARFGERLQVVLRVAPEVLPVAVPYLCLQPLVENAVKHGLEGGSGSCTITVIAQDDGSACSISVEDDGAGSDPEAVRAALAGTSPSDSVGLANVDTRLRAVYGDDHGLVVETAIGAGTKVSLHVPKWSAGVRAS
jgi:two-component system LytT family sensor kinase